MTSEVLCEKFIADPVMFIQGQSQHPDWNGVHYVALNKDFNVVIGNSQGWPIHYALTVDHESEPRDYIEAFDNTEKLTHSFNKIIHAPGIYNITTLLSNKYIADSLNDWYVDIHSAVIQINAIATVEKWISVGQDKWILTQDNDGSMLSFLIV